MLEIPPLDDSYFKEESSIQIAYVRFHIIKADILVRTRNIGLLYVVFYYLVMSPIYSSRPL